MQVEGRQALQLPEQGPLGSGKLYEAGPSVTGLEVVYDRKSQL
jgi:hypothetical protein